MFVLSLVLSCDALMAGPVMRAGALRLNTNSTSTPKSTATTSSTASVGALATYERASRLRPNRLQVSSSSGSSTVNQEILNKVYEEMSRVTNAVEQELYITQREIDKLKDEIAEKDDKISDLEEALAEYEEVKTTVKNIPNVYYSKKEVDAKGYVMPKTLESAITSAKADAREAAVEEINRKGFITADTVSANIANAKTAAIADAVAEIEKRNFATVSSVDNKIANLELGVDETAVANIVENKLTAKDFATNTALQGERTARENALKEYATKEEVEGVDNKFKDISETVAVDLAKNDNFKAQVLSSLDTSISELPSKVTAVENILTTMNNQLFDDEQKPVFVKKPELDTLITVDLIDSKLPTTVCKTKACLTATIGSHYATADDVESKVELKVKNELYDGGDTQKPKFVTGTVLLEKTDGLSSRIDGITPRIASVESAVKSENLKTTIKNMGEFALSSEVASAKEAAIEAAATQAGKLFIKSSDLANNATIVNLNNKFDNYATTAALNNVDGKFQDYTTTANMNSAIAGAKTYADGKAEAAKTAAIAQAATDSNNAITTAKTEINSTINTVKNAVIGIAGNTAVTFDNVSAPDCTSSGCSIKLEHKPGDAM